MADRKGEIGMHSKATFLDWATRNVMAEETPWVLVKTINGTFRWSLPKPRKTVKKTRKPKRSGRDG